jgi:lysophospholipase L1-like esterase
MKKVAIALSITLNLVILATLIWFLSGGGVGLFVRYFIEPTHQRWLSQFEVLEVQPGDTVFLGDSITEGGSWHELFPESHVRNRGIGGDVTSGVLARLEQITKGRPAQVFLLIGTNDLAFGVPQDTIVRNVLEIIDEVHRASPQTEVFVQSVLPRDETYQQAVESLNQALEAGVAERATWVNLYPLFLDEAGISIDDSFSNDELHLYGAAYLRWRDAIAELVKKQGT